MYPSFYRCFLNIYISKIWIALVLWLHKQLIYQYTQYKCIYTWYNLVVHRMYAHMVDYLHFFSLMQMCQIQFLICSYRCRVLVIDPANTWANQEKLAIDLKNVNLALYFRKWFYICKEWASSYAKVNSF